MWLWLVVVGCLSLGVGTAAAQTEKLHFDREKVPVGAAWHYEKSNLDGTRKTMISVHVATTDRLESLKWDAGSPQRTLVVAEMDWPRFCVKKLRSYAVSSGKEPELKATLEYSTAEDRVVVAAAGRQWKIQIKQWPWHSYDFDFASLNLTFPLLRDPQAAFTFGIAD